MATTTTNYNLTKPTMAEIADIRTLNNNMDKVDEVMHSTQVSLAPAYDLLETYNTGDIVMHELLMYKCKEDNVTGAWNPAKWERTTAGENGSGGGGSSVVPNPQGSPTDTLETIEIDGTVYDIAGSGGGSSEPIKIESIWQGTANQTGVDYTTNKSIEDYDYLIFKFRPTDVISGTDETEPFIRDVNDLTDYGTDTFACVYFQNAYVRGAFSDDTTFSLSIISSQGSTAIVLYEIQGVKLIGVGAGAGSEIIPITAGDGTTSRTFTFDRIPKKISMQYVANEWGFYRDIIWGTDRSYYQASQATISESATYIGVSGIVCDETTKSVTITGLNAIQASNTADIVGYMYVDYGGGSGGSAVKDILYSDANGAPHLTDVALAHNIFDYDEVYFKVSNPTDIQTFNAYTQQAFMPMLYNSGERWGIQALYDQRVVEITFASDGLSFQIVRTAGDYSSNTVYEVIGIKH